MTTSYRTCKIYICNKSHIALSKATISTHKYEINFKVVVAITAYMHFQSQNLFAEAYEIFLKALRALISSLFN